jgi:hypothetical protein
MSGFGFAASHPAAKPESRQGGALRKSSIDSSGIVSAQILYEEIYDRSIIAFALLAGG